MHRNRKSQITLFILIGVLVLVATGLYLINLDSKNEKSLSENDLSSASLSKKQVESYINLCLKETSLRAIDIYGLEPEDALGRYIMENLDSCINDYGALKDKARITDEKPSVSVKSENETVIFSLYYPVSINEQANLQNFIYQADLTAFKQIKSGELKSGESLISSDGKARLLFDQDTKVFFAGGQKNPEFLSIKVINRNFGGLENGVVVNSVVYEAQPEGLLFDKPVTLAISLSPEDIKGIDPQRLMLAYFDESSQIWIGLNSEFDPEKMEVRGKISHFSKYSIAICATPTKGRYLIPMEFIANDPFETEDANDPYKWNFNAKEDHSLDNNGIHLLPEFMNENLRDMQVQAVSGSEGKFEAEDTITKFTDFKIADHDFDDQYGLPDFAQYTFKKVLFTEDNTALACNPASSMASCPQITDPVLWARYKIIKTSMNGDVIKSQGILTDDEKQKCLSACSEYAISKLKEKYTWASDSEINKDGIRDFADINCNFAVPAAGSSFDITCASGEYEFDGEMISHYSKTDTTEWIVAENEELKSEFQNPDKKFFSTPNTLGFTASTDLFPVTFKDNLPEIEKRDAFLQNSKYQAHGEFTFDIKKDGSACINSNEASQEGKYAAVVAYIIAADTDYVSAYDCAEDDEYYRQCSRTKPSGYSHNNFRVCEKAGEVCYEMKRQDNRLSDKKFPIGGYSDSGEKVLFEPKILPYYAYGPSVGRRLANPNTREPLNEMDYYVYDTASQNSIETGYDWSCSDMCIWSLNSGSSSGKIKTGDNKINVDVLNIKDPALYARGFLEIQGNGVAGLDECGAKLQDRINYICGCTQDGECSSAMSDRDLEILNCLASIREDLGAYYQTKAMVGHEMELCDINNMIKALENEFGLQSAMGCRYNTPGDPRYGEIKGHIIKDITQPDFGNGGICVGTEKYCRDELDPTTDYNCICGYSSSGQEVIYTAQEDIKYCCRDGPDGSKLLKEPPEDWSSCRGTTTRDKCVQKDVVINLADGQHYLFDLTTPMYLHDYKYIDSYCLYCNESGIAKPVEASKCPDVKIQDTCKFTTLYAEEKIIKPNLLTKGCYAYLNGTYKVGVLECKKVSDEDDEGELTIVNCGDLTYESCPMNLDGTFDCCDSAAKECIDYVPPVAPDSCAAMDADNNPLRLNNFEMKFVSPPSSSGSPVWGCYLCESGSLKKQEDFRCFITEENPEGTLPQNNICEAEDLLDTPEAQLSLGYGTAKCTFVPDDGKVIFGICKKDGNKINTYGEVCGGGCNAGNIGDCCDDKKGCLNEESAGQYGQMCADSTGVYLGAKCPLSAPFCTKYADTNYYCNHRATSNIIDAAYPDCPIPGNIAEIAQFNSIHIEKKCFCSQTNSLVAISINTDYKPSDCYTEDLSCDNNGQSVQNNEYYLSFGDLYACSAGTPTKLFSGADYCFEPRTAFNPQDVSNVRLVDVLSSDKTKICAGNDKWYDSKEMTGGVCDKYKCKCGQSIIGFGDYCSGGVPSLIHKMNIKNKDTCVNIKGCLCSKTGDAAEDQIPLNYGMVCLEKCWVGGCGFTDTSCKAHSDYVPSADVLSYTVAYGDKACYPDNSAKMPITSGQACTSYLGCTCNGNSVAFGASC